MTERCQTKFTEKFENQNYVIYGGILVASLAVLYVYRFHFATIAFSYVLGCVACYYGLNSNVLDSLVNKMKCHSAPSGAEAAAEERGDASCDTCGSSNCPRHDSASSEPWVGLHIHKQLDLAIEKLYDAILERFVSAWHGRLAARRYFADELRLQLRRASAVLLRRAGKVDYARFLMERLIPCALRHYTLCADAAADATPRLRVHPAAANRAAELRYLRSLTAALMPHLLDPGDLNNEVFSVLVREIFAGWVLQPLADVLADPYVLNALLLLATGPETMAPLPAAPDYRVEFLSSFAAVAGCPRARLLRVQLERLLGEPAQLYAFMQHIKSTPHLRLLHLYQDLKQFQTRLLNPSASGAEQAELCREGGAMLARHAHAHEHRDLRAALDTGNDIKRLQTSPALFAAANEARAALHTALLPRFLHSDEFYRILIGPRIPTGYHKQSKRQPVPHAPHAGSAPVLASAAPDATPDATPDDEPDAAAILAYLDRLAADELDDLLGTYKVSLTKVDTRLVAGGSVRVFSVCVFCGGSGRLWEVQRSEHDFHLLRGKLVEYHGERLLAALPLPSRRDNSPDETLRYKYEDFLQRALLQPLLQASALLRLFLCAPGEQFARDTAAAALAAGPDLHQLVHSVTLRLRKEKGQHLDAFLTNFLLSADMERYQAFKQGAGVEEAGEAARRAVVLRAASCGTPCSATTSTWRPPCPRPPPEPRTRTTWSASRSASCICCGRWCTRAAGCAAWRAACWARRAVRWTTAARARSAPCWRGSRASAASRASSRWATTSCSVRGPCRRACRSLRRLPWRVRSCGARCRGWPCCCWAAGCRAPSTPRWSCCSGRSSTSSWCTACSTCACWSCSRSWAPQITNRTNQRVEESVLKNCPNLYL